MNAQQLTDVSVAHESKKNGHRGGTLKIAPELSEKGDAQPPFADKTLSVVIRTHKPERMPFLEEAIFSLAIQEWTNIEIVVVIQNGTDDFARAIEEIILHQPWRKEPRFKVHCLEFEPGMDGRSELLNYGIKNSIGRYLAFLDDDDVVYHHGYATLIRQLEEDKGLAVAAGGCRVARTAQKSDYWYFNTKDTPFTFGRSRYDLFRDNFIPIHSYVIDRRVVNSEDLYFDNEMPPLEDYDFLLRLSAKYEFDFSKLDVFVCEYRIHNSNSIPYTGDATPEQITKYERAHRMIEEKKKTLRCLIPLPDLLAINHQQKQIEEFKPPLPENPKILQRILLSGVEGVYDFFRKYPKLEKKLSETVHNGWSLYEKRKKPPTG